MTPKQAEKALERAAAAYWAEVDRIAAALRARYVVPYCDRTGAKFSAGMGSYGFHGKNGEQMGGSWDIDVNEGRTPPARVYNACEVRDHIKGQSLGSLMEDC